MKLDYEEVVAEQERWYPIILWCNRNSPAASQKARLILSAIVEWAGWSDEEFYQEVMGRFEAHRRSREAIARATHR